MITNMMNDSSIASSCLSDGENLILTHPTTLIEDEHYVYRDDYLFDELAALIVKFAAYTACPAIVIVCNDSGQRVRCPRDRLYRQSVESPSGFIEANYEPG